MTTTFPASINGRNFSPDEQSNSNNAWVRALAFAHRKELSYCCCVRADPPRLSVKLYGRETPAMHYGLARWPDTGLDHDLQCQYFSEDSDGEAGAGSKPAFVDLGEGKYRAHLAITLQIVERHAKDIEAEKTVKAPTASRARASEVSLLFKLWRTAGLNVYRGTPRSWFSATYSLINAAKRFIVNKDGNSLADFMLVASNAGDRLATAHNQEVIARTAKQPSRLFVVGRMKAFKKEKQQILLPMQDFQLLPKILVQVGQLDQFLHGRNFFKNLLEDKSGHVVTIACIEPSGNDWWRTVSIAGMATTPSMVPVESSFEVEFADYLGAQSRKYLKPIIVGETGDSGNRPDFILLDTSPRTFCEVWGTQTPKYLAAKRTRIARFAAKRQPLVNWRANPREPLPVLPPPSLMEK